MAKTSSTFRYFLLTTIIFLSIITFYIYKIYTSKPNIQKYTFVYVYPTMNLQQLADTLERKRIIAHKFAFHLLAKQMHLKNLKPGKYRITSNMTLPAIIRLFKNQQDEKVTINIHANIFYLDDFINAIDNKLMIQKEDIIRAIHEYPSIKDKEWLNYLFIKSYKVNWAIDANSILDSILNYYHKIWNSQRLQLLRKTTLTQKEAMILASIVQHESHIFSEQRKIAGVYLNRLKKQMPLQADPTLKYLHHKMDANRVYNSDKENNSPYNTYKFKGLPPTTLGAVSIQALDAVLNFESHNYLYFCAKPELNGYSNYSETFQQHLKYARQYQQKLNELNIK
ncbi:MAG: aminodeoxychorismate lyase [Bacteroidia bacterium]|nr:MAG: aminodeoxychorismate lyase [Bacteroidia bacterium]